MGGVSRDERFQENDSRRLNNLEASDWRCHRARCIDRGAAMNKTLVVISLGLALFSTESAARKPSPT